MCRSMLAVAAVLTVALMVTTVQAGTVTLNVPSNRFFAGAQTWLHWTNDFTADLAGATLTVDCGTAGIIDPADKYACLSSTGGYIKVTGGALSANGTQVCSGTISGLQASSFDGGVVATPKLSVLPRAVAVVSPVTSVKNVLKVLQGTSINVTFSPQSLPALPDRDISISLTCTDLIAQGSFTWNQKWLANTNDTLYFNGVGQFPNIGNVMCSWSMDVPSQASDFNDAVALPTPIYLTVVPVVMNVLTVTGATPAGLSPVLSAGSPTAETNFTVTIANPIPASNSLASIRVGMSCSSKSGVGGVDSTLTRVTAVGGGVGTVPDNSVSGYGYVNFTRATNAPVANFTVTIPAIPAGSGANVQCDFADITTYGDQFISWSYPFTSFNFFVGVVQNFTLSLQNVSQPLTVGTASIEAGQIVVTVGPPIGTILYPSIFAEPVCTQAGPNGIAPVAVGQNGAFKYNTVQNKTWTFTAPSTPGTVTCTHTISGVDAPHFAPPPPFSVNVVDQLSLKIVAPISYEYANNTQDGFNITVTNPQAESRSLTVAMTCTVGYNDGKLNAPVTVSSTSANVDVSGNSGTFADGATSPANSSLIYNIQFAQLQTSEGQIVQCAFNKLAGSVAPHYYKPLTSIEFYVGTQVQLTTNMYNSTTLTVGDSVPVYINTTVPAIINQLSDGLEIVPQCTYCSNTGSGLMAGNDAALQLASGTIFPATVDVGHFTFTAGKAGTVKCTFTVTGGSGSTYDYYHFSPPADITFTIKNPAPLKTFTISTQGNLLPNVGGPNGIAGGYDITVLPVLTNTTTSVYLNITAPKADVALTLQCVAPGSGTLVNVATYGGEPPVDNIFRRRLFLIVVGISGTLTFKNSTTTDGSFVISNLAPTDYNGLNIKCTFGDIDGNDGSKWQKLGTFNYFVGPVRPLILTSTDTVTKYYPGDTSHAITLGTDPKALVPTPNQGTLTVDVLCTVSGSYAGVTVTNLTGALLPQSGVTGATTITFPNTDTTFAFNVTSNVAGTVICTVTGPLTAANGDDFRHFSLATQSVSLTFLPVPSFTFSGEAVNSPKTDDLDAQPNLPGTQNMTQIKVMNTLAVTKNNTNAKITLKCYIQRFSSDAPDAQDNQLQVSTTDFSFNSTTASSANKQQVFNVSLPNALGGLDHRAEQIRCVPSYSITGTASNLDLSFVQPLTAIYFTVGTRGTLKLNPRFTTPIYAFNGASFAAPSSVPDAGHVAAFAGVQQGAASLSSDSQYTTAPTYSYVLTPSFCNGNGAYVVEATCTGGASLTFGGTGAPLVDNNDYLGTFTPGPSLKGMDYVCTFNQVRQWNTAYTTPAKITITTVTPGQILIAGAVTTISNATAPSAPTQATVALSVPAPTGGVTVVVSCLSSFLTQQLDIAQSRFYFFEGTSGPVPFTLQATDPKFTYTECTAETESTSFNGDVDGNSALNYGAYTATWWNVNQKRYFTVSDISSGPTCGLQTVTLTMSGAGSVDPFTVTAKCGRNLAQGATVSGLIVEAPINFNPGQTTAIVHYQSPGYSLSDRCDFQFAVGKGRMSDEDQAVTITNPIMKYFITGAVGGWTVTPPASLSVAPGTNLTFTVAPKPAPLAGISLDVYVDGTQFTNLDFSPTSGAQSFSVLAPEIPNGQQSGQSVVAFYPYGADSGSYAGLQSYTIVSAGANVIALTASNTTNIQQNSVVTLTSTPVGSIQINVNVTLTCTGAPALSTGTFSYIGVFLGGQTSAVSASFNIGTASVGGNVVTCTFSTSGPGAPFTTFTSDPTLKFDFYPPGYTGPHIGSSSSSSGGNGNSTSSSGASSSSSGSNNGTSSSSSSSSGTTAGSSSSSSSSGTNNNSSSSSSTGACDGACSAIAFASLPSMAMYAVMLLASLFASRH